MLKNNTIRVGILGCGKIFAAHLHAIQKNKSRYALAAICDHDSKQLSSARRLVRERGIKYFSDFNKMLNTMEEKMDMLVVATPNAYHYKQVLDALGHGYNVLVEKPPVFSEAEVSDIVRESKNVKKNVYVVLQVRYNPPVQTLMEVVRQKLLGKIRTISLILRWQRPSEYFATWRGNKKISGGVLYEVGVHYLDVLRCIFGKPRILSSHCFKLKNGPGNIEDTIYSVVRFPNNIPCNIEISLVAEPRNLECSISVMGDTGFIKIGGKALDKIERTEFLNKTEVNSFNLLVSKQNTPSLKPNNYSNYLGSCPNHPIIYKEIAEGRGISISEASGVIKFIEDIYKYA